MKTKTQKKAKGSRTQGKNEIKSYIFSVIKALPILIILLLISAFICLKTDLSSKYYFIFSIASCAVSSFFSGFFIGKAVRKRGVVCGLIGAGIICLLMFVFSAIISGFNFSAKPFIAAAAMLLSGMFGGISAVNMRR